MHSPKPTPREIAAQNVAWWKATDPRQHERRFEIQLHHGPERQNVYVRSWPLVEIVLRANAKPDDANRPDRIIVNDGCDTYSRVLTMEKSWCGYMTKLRRGAAQH